MTADEERESNTDSPAKEVGAWIFVTVLAKVVPMADLQLELQVHLGQV